MASVLVVDDDPASRQYLRALFTHRGHEVYEASDGEAALRVVDEHRPDAVFTDVLMPGLDGPELARMLRSRPPTATVPIVFTTAYYDRGEIQPLAHACGVRHILRKPAKPATVLAVVDAVLAAGARPVRDQVDAERDFTEQHRTTLKAKLLKTTNALHDYQARDDRLRREVILLRGMLTETQQTTAAGVWHLDPRTGAVLLSPALMDRLGLPARLPRPEIWHRVHPDDRSALTAAVLTARRSGHPRATRVRFADAEGAVRELAVTCRSAGPYRIWGIAQDLTEVCQEQRLRVHTHALAQAHRLVKDSWHAAMVPRKPAVPGTVDLATAYLTAPDRVDTGADWYDVLPLPDGRILLTIGSVAGHRLPGPTVAGPIRAVLRAYALDQPEPADLLTRLNRYLLTTVDDDTYVTALAAVYHPDGPELSLANAGHPAPMLIDHDRATGIPTVRELPAEHPPLGISPDPGYRTRQVILEPTTLVCAYTDSLIDARIDESGGQPVMADLVTAALTAVSVRRRPPTAQQTLDRILSALLRAEPSGVLGDDIGLLVLAPVG